MDHRVGTDAILHSGQALSITFIATCSLEQTFHQAISAGRAGVAMAFVTIPAALQQHG
jgi:hypothetical protein